MDRWSISTEHGTTAPPEAVSRAFADHHGRLLSGWRALTDEQWQAPSRNAGWTVHDTVRHVADVMELVAADALGTPPPFATDGFDPRTTPDAWMQASAGEDPAATIERFATNAFHHRAHVDDRLAAGGDERAPTVYGMAHWHLSMIHVLWDSWLHERDVLLALGRPAPSTEAEQRLAALYGMLMCFVPALRMDRPGSAAVACSGTSAGGLAATLADGRITATELDEAPVVTAAPVDDLVDALSGRGTPLRVLVPDAPEGLDFFARFMAG